MSWRNAGNEIIIEALCPKDLQPKDLKCSFNSHTLLLEVAGKPIATGKLFAAIKPDECTWEFGPLSPHLLEASMTLEIVRAVLKSWLHRRSILAEIGRDRQQSHFSSQLLSGTLTGEQRKTQP